MGIRSRILRLVHAAIARGRGEFNLRKQSGELWEERASTCAEWIADLSPRPRSVADVGCGNQRLKRALAAKGALAEYQGFDLRPQAADVLPFDVQRDTLPRAFDVCALLGVIEYVAEPAAHLRRLAARSKWLVMSHVVADLPGASSKSRAVNRWTTTLTEAELAEVLKQANMTVVKRRVISKGQQVLYLCECADELS